MPAQTLASTILLWRVQFNEHPELSYDDYRLNWAMLQNNAEGKTETAKSASLVHKYIKLFKAEAEAAKVVEAATVVEAVKVVEAPHHLDTMQDILKVQSQLAGLMQETIDFTKQCKYLAEVMDKAIEMLTDNRIITDLTAKANKLQAEVNNLKLHVEEAEAKAKQEREYRNRPIHGEATR